LIKEVTNLTTVNFLHIQQFLLAVFYFLGISVISEMPFTYSLMQNITQHITEPNNLLLTEAYRAFTSSHVTQRTFQ